MQLQQLQYFVAVAETRHFTRAAEVVHVAQPSLSQQIKALERELGADLFLRARGNITLTDAGEALLPLARRILADADTARHEVLELAQLRRGRVRLGATPSLCTGLLPDVLRAFHDRYPGIQLLIEEGGSHDLVRELARGALRAWLLVAGLPAGLDRVLAGAEATGGAAAGGPGGGRRSPRTRGGRRGAGRRARAVRWASPAPGQGERLVMVLARLRLWERTVAACRSDPAGPDVCSPWRAGHGRGAGFVRAAGSAGGRGPRMVAGR
ncbi:LysR family transcriptional regulator OS=Streptomyces tendae OX=1932 GN=GUR47_03865 PE=3 SV=1 [Streptomyces tendae]